VTLRRAERHYALMGRASRRTVQVLARFEANRNVIPAAEIDQFLQPRVGGTLGD
jgi:hypothetical protein